MSSIAPSVLAGVNFVFGHGDFSTISGPSGGSVSGHFDGFSLITDEGVQIYNDKTVNGYSACHNTDGGARLEVSSACWEGPITLSCKSNFGGQPDQCSGDYMGNHFDGKSDSSATFIGIAIGLDASCGGNVVVDTKECTEEMADVTFKYP